jgi:hypothetical protein
MHAFGVDLTPLAALRTSLETRWAEKQRLDAAWMETKRQISWYRRQLNGLICEAGEYSSLDKIRFETELAYKEVAVPIRVYLTMESLQNLLKTHKALHSTLLEAVRAAANCALDAEIVSEQIAQSTVNNVQLTQNKSSMDDSVDVNKYSTTYNQFDKSKLSSQEDKRASERSVVEPQEPKTKMVPVAKSSRIKIPQKSLRRSAISRSSRCFMPLRSVSKLIYLRAVVRISRKSLKRPVRYCRSWEFINRHGLRPAMFWGGMGRLSAF